MHPVCRPATSCALCAALIQILLIGIFNSTIHSYIFFVIIWLLVRYIMYRRLALYIVYTSFLIVLLLEAFDCLIQIVRIADGDNGLSCIPTMVTFCFFRRNTLFLRQKHFVSFGETTKKLAVILRVTRVLTFTDASFFKMMYRGCSYQGLHTLINFLYFNMLQ